MKLAPNGRQMMTPLSAPIDAAEVQHDSTKCALSEVLLHT